MKLSLNRDAALTAVARVQSVVLRTHTIPILGNMLLTAREGALAMMATDLDIQSTHEAEARVELGGTITVPAARFYEILRSFPIGGEISLVLEGDKLIVKCGRSRFQLATLPAGDFPVFGAVGGGPGSISKKVLAELIDRTAFAMSNEATRYYLCGLNLHLVEVAGVKLLRAVATDGSRLALAETPAPEDLLSWPSVILPRKTVAELRRMLEGDGEIDLASDGKKVWAVAGSAETASKLIDGNFPDYTRVIPRDNAHAVSADVDLLTAAIKRVAIVAGGDKTRAVRLELDAGRIIIRSRDPGDGSVGEEEIEVDYAGEAINLGFNSAYMLEALAQVSGENAQIKFGGPNDPVLVVDPNVSTHLGVVMPLRV